MASHTYWQEIQDEVTLWNKIIGKDAEDEAESRSTARKIFRDIATGQYRCIEIGAGIGRLLRHATEFFTNAVGVDISISVIDFANRYLNDLNSSAHVEYTDGQRLAFADERADFVYSFTCFQHMEEMETVTANISEIFRVLKPGAGCVIQTVCGDPSEVGRYDGIVFKTAEDFWQLFATVGFERTEVTTEGEWIWVRAKKPLAR